MEEYYIDTISLYSFQQALPQDMRRKKFNTDYWQTGMWATTQKNTLFKLFIKTEEGMKCFVTDVGSPSKNEQDKINGGDAFDAIENHFKKRTGLKLNEAFGKTTMKEFAKWRPEPIADRMPLCMNNERYHHCYKADFSSAYPSCMCGALPDINSAVIENGEVEPTTEYPFSFFSDGTSAELNSYDMRQLSEHPLRQSHLTGKERWKQHDEVLWTIRMKKSEYSLDDEMNYFYDKKRNGDKDAKAILNKFIGMMQRNTSISTTTLLAVITLCRHVYKMCCFYNDLVDHGQVPFLMITDCFIWYGDSNMNLNREKKLGKLVLEHEDCDFGSVYFNYYVIEDPQYGNTYTHAGIEDERKSISIEQLFSNKTVTHYLIGKTGLLAQSKINTGVD